MTSYLTGKKLPVVAESATTGVNRKIIFQRANREDLGEILSLQKLAYRSEAALYEDYSIPPLRQTLEEIMEDFKLLLFLKAFLNKKIIGSVRSFQKEGTGYIERLIVSPVYQKQGIGRELMHRIEAELNSVKRYELFTGAKSLKNISFYEKLGYKAFKTEQVTERLAFVYMEKRRIIEERLDTTILSA